jgi:hypothetical protein
MFSRTVIIIFCILTLSIEGGKVEDGDDELDATEGGKIRFFKVRYCV